MAKQTRMGNGLRSNSTKLPSSLDLQQMLGNRTMRSAGALGPALSRSRQVQNITCLEIDFTCSLVPLQSPLLGCRFRSSMTGQPSLRVSLCGGSLGSDSWFKTSTGYLLASAASTTLLVESFSAVWSGICWRS